MNPVLDHVTTKSDLITKGMQQALKNDQYDVDQNKNTNSMITDCSRNPSDNHRRHEEIIETEPITKNANQTNIENDSLNILPLEQNVCNNDKKSGKLMFQEFMDKVNMKIKKKSSKGAHKTANKSVCDFPKKKDFHSSFTVCNINRIVSCKIDSLGKVSQMPAKIHKKIKIDKLFKNKTFVKSSDYNPPFEGTVPNESTEFKKTCIKEVEVAAKKTKVNNFWTKLKQSSFEKGNYSII